MNKLLKIFLVYAILISISIFSSYHFGKKVVYGIMILNEEQEKHFYVNNPGAVNDGNPIKAMTITTTYSILYMAIAFIIPFIFGLFILHYLRKSNLHKYLPPPFLFSKQ